MSVMLRRLLDWLAPVKVAAKRSTAVAGIIQRMAPLLDPEPSTLDAWDRPTRPLCSVIGCPNDPTSAPHGWSVCPEHCPVNV